MPPQIICISLCVQGLTNPACKTLSIFYEPAVSGCLSIGYHTRLLYVATPDVKLTVIVVSVRNFVVQIACAADEKKKIDVTTSWHVAGLHPESL